MKRIGGDFLEIEKIMERAEKYLEEKKNQAAIEEFTKVLEIDPDNAAAYYNRGNAYYFQEKYEQAIADYTEALRIDPANVLAYIYRGVAYSNQGEYEQAIADYTKAWSIDPSYVAAYNNRAVTYADKEKYKESAVADHMQALYLDSNRAYVKRGDNYEKQGVDYTMENKKFITQKELDFLEEKTNLKLDNLSNKIDGNFNNISQKLDHLEKDNPNQIKIILYEKEEQHRKDKTETNRFLVGTIILGVISIGISIVSFFV